MKKNRKMLVISGLIVICIIAAGAFIFNQNPKVEGVPQHIGGIVKDVTPNGIETPAVTDIESPAGLEIPVVEPTEPTVITVMPITEISPIERATPTPGQSSAVSVQDGNNIALTAITGRPEPPELPETAFVWEQDEEVTPEDVEAYEALDPALRNPDVRPDITPAPVRSTPTPTPQTPSSTSQTSGGSTPQGGERNANGEVYFPGFRWIPQGGPNNVERSGSDGDWNKQIGSMN